MMKNLVPAFIALFLYSCSGSEAEKTGDQNSVKLVFSPTQGEVYPMIAELTAKEDSTGDGTHYIIGFTNTISAVDDAKITVLTHYDEITMTALLGGQETKLTAPIRKENLSDTARLAAPVFAYFGKTFETVYDHRHNKTDEKQVRMAADSFVVAAESKIQFIGRYPDKMLKKGDSWTSETPIRVGSDEIKDMQYTVEEIAEKEVKIKLAGTIKNDSEKFGHAFKVEGDISGEIWVDRKTGWQNRAALKIQLLLSMDGRKTPMKKEIRLRPR